MGGFLACILAGAAMSIQGVMNTRLSEHIGTMETNAFVQCVAAVLSLLVLVFWRTVADAVARVDISRSAFYKYKDFVSPFQDMSRGHLVTFNLELLDRQGVLSSVLAIFAENGANILTINQSIPTSGVAPVTITAATENMQTTMEAFMAALKAADGIIRVHLMAG